MKIFFNQNQSASKNESSSPSATKPALFVKAVQEAGFDVEIESNFQPLKPVHLALAHDSLMVRNILNGKRSNGFGNTLKEVAVTLPWTSSSMYNAALYALKNNTFTCSPTSGFHHAGYDSASAYCTFNGLMVTAQMLRLYQGMKRVGIIDLDAHYGNGTDQIIKTLHAESWCKHYTSGRELFTNNAEEWLKNLPSSISCIMKESDVILVQLGADPHINDPLGGFLTTEQMIKRDQIVFAMAKKHNKPLVWNLAGGYQNPIEKVLEIHINSVRECIRFMKK